MALSAGSRSFTRYGYADLLREDRRFEILWRIWPGTQRLLLWADPVFAEPPAPGVPGGRELLKRAAIRCAISAGSLWS